MPYLIDLIRWIAFIGFLVCLSILFVPAFVGLYRISHEENHVEEAPADFIDADFTVIVTEDK